mmetsp:Transcript_67828/g.126709  ORF Transcript_67828/g.126709 Transcript_67828/m.126709 type:complete len:116 (+) Transcript_67828:316-663(+)
MVRAFNLVLYGAWVSLMQYASTLTVSSTSAGAACIRSQISVICGKFTVVPGLRAFRVSPAADVAGGSLRGTPAHMSTHLVLHQNSSSGCSSDDKGAMWGAVAKVARRTSPHSPTA